MPLPLPQDFAPLHVLVADGDSSIRKACCTIVAHEGMVPHEAELTASARTLLLAKGADIALVDEAIATGEGFGLEELRELRPDIDVVWMTSASTVQIVVEAMRSGASDYLVKPFSTEELACVLRRLACRRQVDTASRSLRERLRSSHGLGDMLGESPEMEKLFRIIARVAQGAHPVLILGEPGTGKESVARAIHSHGPGASQPFFPVDCGSVARDRIEDELLGVASGSLTRSKRTSDGVLLAAGSGTVFLDSVGDLPPDLQMKLVRILQEKQLRPADGGGPLPMRARILAAGNHELESLIQQGKFRRDLYQRLGVVKLTLPPLRERKDDIPLLAAYFLERSCRETRRSFRLSPQALSYLVEYDWPANVGELSNAIQHACNVSSGEVIELGDMTTAIRDAHHHANALRKSASMERTEIPLVETLAEMEKRAILTMLSQVNGDKLLAARLLNIGKTTLYRKLKEYGVQA